MSIPTENRKLLDAIESGDVKELEQVIDTENVGIMDLTFSLPQAVISNKEAIVKCLLVHGADMHYFDRGGGKPLILMATPKTHYNIFKLLLEKAKSLNIEYSGGNLAHVAVRSRNLQVLEDTRKFEPHFLLFDKTDSRFHRTPLHEAIFLLTEGKAKEKFQERENVSFSPEPTSPDDLTPPVAKFTHFIEHEIIKFFIQLKANVNTQDRFWRTPLHDAAKAGNMDVTLMLLNEGAERYVEDKNHFLPWMDAVEAGYESLADMLLLEQDFYKQIQNNKFNENHIFAAVSVKSLTCVKYLIKRGFDAGDHRLIDREGVTPLIKACQNRDAHISALLVRFTATTVNLKTSTRYSAVNYALDAWSDRKQTAWKRILDDLIKLGADMNLYVGVHNVHVLMQRDYLVNMWKLDWILSQSPDLNVRSKEGWYLFEIAIYHASMQRPSHLGLKILIKLLNNGMRVPWEYRYHQVHKKPAPRRSNILPPSLIALKGRHMVLTYVLHLIGCRTPSNILNNWSHTYDTAGFKSLSKETERLVDHLIEKECMPLSLFDITRNCVLNCLCPGNVNKVAESLPIPIKLKQRLDWEVFIDTIPKELDGYYKVIKEMLQKQDGEEDSTEWEGFIFEPDVSFNL